MKDPFRSARLLYRAVEDSQEDKDLFHAIQVDPVAYTNTNSTLIRPQGKEAGLDEWFSIYNNRALLGVVIICLVPLDTIPPTPPVPIGCIALTRPFPPHDRDSSINVDILAQYRRQGCGSEAVEWALNWGFQMAGLHRIGLVSYSYNDRATRLFESLEFVQEGRMRERSWFDGGWHDLLLFSMLEDEWRARRREGSS